MVGAEMVVVVVSWQRWWRQQRARGASSSPLVGDELAVVAQKSEPFQKIECQSIEEGL